MDHLAEHGVTPEEAEEALLDRRAIPVPAYSTPGERRYGTIGATNAGRIFLVVYTRHAGKVRAVTAWDADRREKRRYRRAGR